MVLEGVYFLDVEIVEMEEGAVVGVSDDGTEGVWGFEGDGWMERVLVQLAHPIGLIGKENFATPFFESIKNSSMFGREDVW